MRKIALIICVVFLLALTACEKCRYVEPAIGLISIELVFLDSTGVNVFDNQYDINELELSYADGDSVSFETGEEQSSVRFFFERNSGNFDQQINTDYVIKFSSSDTDYFTISYESTESGDCGGWRYKYVDVIYEGENYSRPDNIELVEIEI
jgi:hypothetical protein